MKTWVKCGVEQPLEAFHRDPQNRDGLRGQCKPCYRLWWAVKALGRIAAALGWIATAFLLLVFAGGIIVGALTGGGCDPTSC